VEKIAQKEARGLARVAFIGGFIGASIWASPNASPQKINKSHIFYNYFFDLKFE
jgi:hypothetical protein